MEFEWKSPDGLVLPCRKWETDGAPKAVLVCVHGLSGSPLEFGPVGERGALHGISTFALSVRGQGNDPRLNKRGAELDLLAIERDVAAFAAMARSRAGNAPLFLCGESMGSLILMHAEPPAGAEGIIFSVPVVDIRNPVSPVLRKVMEIVVRMFPFFRIKPSVFATAGMRPKLTRIEAYDDEVRKRPTFIKTYTAKFLFDLGELVFTSAMAAKRVTVPSLVLAGGNDCFVSTSQVETWFGKLASEDKTMKIYPESYHLLWHDLDHKVVLDDIIHWVESRLSGENVPDLSSTSLRVPETVVPSPIVGS